MPGRGRPFQKKYRTDEERHEAQKAQRRDYYRRNKERLLALDAEKYRNDPAFAAAKAAGARRRKLEQEYGLTVEQYDALVKAQGGVCKICVGPPVVDQNLAVDHCHKTGAVRGLLCRKCNSAIGLLNDDPNLVRRALEYLHG